MKRYRIMTVCLFVLLSMSCQKHKSSIPTADSQDVGISKDHLRLLDVVVERAISRREIPGAVVLVAGKGKVVWNRAYGDSQWIPEKKPMRLEMIFDMASLTKPVVTATSVMILIERGRLRLWDKVGDFVPDLVPFKDEDGNSGEDMRIWHLLTHTSGLPPYLETETVSAECGDPCALENMMGIIARLERKHPPGKEFVYSDLGFITLGYIVQKISGSTLDEFAAENIFTPLKMKHTFFNPSRKYLNDCVPTEMSDKGLLRGVVHDPRARLLGGVAGHAGLFSTADDLAVFAQMMLNKGLYEGARVLSPSSVDRLTEVCPLTAFSGRGLGWDLDSPYSTNGGDLFGPNSYGHTGYTGTSLWIDPDTETFVILLTNRVHPYDEGEVVSLRGRVANIVAGAITGEE